MDFKKIDYHTDTYLKKNNIVKEGDKYYTFIKFGNSNRHKVELTRNRDQALKEIYENKSISRNGRDTFYYQVRKRYGNITKAYAFEWLKQQENYQLHLIQRRESALKPIAYDRICKMWQIDLIDMKNYSGPQNRQKKWILCCIDVFSKYAWAVPMANKESYTCRQALEKILNDHYDNMVKRYPTLIQSDNGPEFVNADFKFLFKTFEITHVRAPPYLPQAQAVVERFNRTLKNLIFANMTKNGNKKWVDDLPILLKNYNNSYHSTIKEAPINVHIKGKKNLKQVKLIHDLKDKLIKSSVSYPVLNKGDSVRLHILTNKEARKKDVFSKKYLPQWSKEIYTVEKIIGENSEKIKPRYMISDNKKTIGTYYRHDLQLIS